MKLSIKLFCFLLLTTNICAHPAPFSELLKQAQYSLDHNNLEQAQDFLTQALSCRPHDTEMDRIIGNKLLWLGNQFFDRSQNQQALDCFKKILSISDNFSSVHHNIAFTLAERFGNHQEALKHYEKALAINPDATETHFCASFSYLATGNLEQGFKEYEYRWQRGINGQRNFLDNFVNLWDGKTPLEGTTFLIRAEQGLGDTLQFIRYAQQLKARGAFVCAEVQKPLYNLLKICPYLDYVFPIGSPLPLFDYQAPLLSLPHLCKTTLATIPHPCPYLYADTALCNQWLDYFASEPRFKIGICWHGDTAHGSSKFIPLHEFIPLLSRSDVKIYSLQMHDGLDQISLLPTNVSLEQFPASFDIEHGSFMDTAAVMRQLDLVITVDTSVAHLAGGLGVPVWVILPFPAEWRWLVDRCDSAWYPTMTLFRQAADRDWQSVVLDMLNALDVVIATKKM